MGREERRKGWLNKGKRVGRNWGRGEGGNTILTQTIFYRKCPFVVCVYSLQCKPYKCLVSQFLATRNMFCHEGNKLFSRGNKFKVSPDED